MVQRESREHMMMMMMMMMMMVQISHRTDQNTEKDPCLSINQPHNVEILKWLREAVPRKV
jgi:hypothetical protein